MVAAAAELETSIDSKQIAPGDQIKAKLTRGIHLASGEKLPAGTELVGRVTADRSKPDNVRVALRFDRAILKHGKTIPVEAMIVSILPSPSSYYGTGSSGAGDSWTKKTLQVEQIGAVHGADLNARIGGRNSGVITSHKDKDVRIGAGTNLSLAIAKRSLHHGQQNANAIM